MTAGLSGRPPRESKSTCSGKPCLHALRGQPARSATRTRYRTGAGMPTHSSHGSRDPAASSTPVSSTRVVLREAKRLHRAATSDSPSSALPMLRRLLAARAVPTRTLPQLFRVRDTVQRKHILRTLAFEAGYRSWEEYRKALPRLDAQPLLQAFLSERYASHLNLWFTNETEAMQFAAAHGGRALRIGKQAVVLPTAPIEDAEAVEQLA